MKPESDNARRGFMFRLLGAGAAMMLGGCQRLSETAWFPRVLATGEKLSELAATTLGPRAMAQEFPASELSPFFRSNGTAEPNSSAYKTLLANGFSDYRLAVGGLVEAPREFSLAELKSLPARTQITRHDCVEGWSAIGKWTGVRLSAVLAAVKPMQQARFVVLHCADPMNDDGTGFYYESIDLADANHEQTLLAYELNDAALPVQNGAPLRLRVERQLGYKHAKYVMRLEVVESFAGIAGGRGGYWEDQGYQWFAGI